MPPASAIQIVPLCVKVQPVIAFQDWIGDISMMKDLTKSMETSMREEEEQEGAAAAADVAGATTDAAAAKKVEAAKDAQPAAVSDERVGWSLVG